jgi:hypothetical protein
MPPSVRHEAVLLLLRARPALLAELLRRASGLELPAVETVTFACETVRELSPIVLRADAVIAFGREDDGPIAIFEVQLAPDGEKRLAWPVYVAVVHRETGRPVLLVVLALGPRERRARGALGARARSRRGRAGGGGAHRGRDDRGARGRGLARR